MATATITARRNQNIYRQPATLQLGPTSATFVVIALISVLALLYLNQITKTGTFGYKVTDLSSKLEQVTQQKQELSVQAARLQSIQTIQASNVAHSMVPVAQVTYAQ